MINMKKTKNIIAGATVKAGVRISPVLPAGHRI
jgi:hypothetical protein